LEFVRVGQGTVVNKSEGILVGIRGPVLALVSGSVSSVVVITTLVSRVSITIARVVRSAINTGIIRAVVIVSSLSNSLGFGLRFSLGHGFSLSFSIYSLVVWGIESGDTIAAEILIIVEGARVVGVSCVSRGTEGVSWVGGPNSVSSIGVGTVVIATKPVKVSLGFSFRFCQSSHNAKGG